MYKDPLVSIAILNHNGLNYLRETIPAVSKLDYSNYEIVVFDNGSTDKSIKYLKSLNNNRIRIVRNKENEGSVIGKSKCISYCKGEYILILDNDILVDKSSLIRSLIKIYSSLDKVAFLGILLRDKGQNMTKYYGTYFNSFYGINLTKDNRSSINLSKRNIINSPTFHGAAVFFSRKNFDKVGGFDNIQKTFMDDTEISIRACVLGYKNYIYTQSCLVHLGKSKDEDKSYFASKFKYHLSGILITYYKNFELKNLISKGIVFLLMAPLIYSYLAVKKRNFLVLIYSIWSVFFFLKNLHYLTKERKLIQSRRASKDESFLSLKPSKLQPA